jgi:transcriptional regulator with XRE-family HTH domain
MLIQKLRLQRAWSQEQLAEVSGLSVRTIQRLERGQTASLESLKALASVFETDLSTLKESTMDKSPPDVVSATAAVRPDEALALAHVRKVKGFYLHLIQFVAILAMLTILNLATSPSYLWIVWVAMFWGLGVVIHALQTFNLTPFFNGAWERREVEKYLGRKL